MLTPADDLPVAHGYTLRDLQQMTAAACKADRLLAMPYEQRHDIAWSEIAYTLVSAEQPPQRQALIRVGWQAIYRHIREGLRERGYQDGMQWASGEPTMPRFAQFWGHRVVPSHEEPIVEQIATGQVMATVTGAPRDALLALAACENYQTAAAALDINYKALLTRLRVGRGRFLALWHEGETPHRVRRTNRLAEATGKKPFCHAGHEWTPENTRVRRRTVRGQVVIAGRDCLACERDRSKRRSTPAGCRTYAAP